MTAIQSPPEPTLGAWIRAIRLDAGMSQTALAEKMSETGAVDVTQADVSRWERSLYVPDVFEMRRFAEVTGAEYVLDLRVLPSRWTTPDTLAA